MLTQQLRELERDGIVRRKEYPETPLRVEYQLTDLGLTLMPVGRHLEEWGKIHMSKVQRAQSRYKARTGKSL